MLTTARSEQIADFYLRNAEAVHGRVARRISAPTATIEDACQHAWTTLLRRDDLRLDGRATGWLVTVAGHHALDVLRRPEVPTQDPAGARAAPADVPERVLERECLREQTADLAQLKPRERRDLALKAAGHSYNEIAALTGSSYTAIDRRLKEGRAHLRRLQQQRRDHWGD